VYTPLVPPSPLLGIPPIDFFNDINNLGGRAFPTTIRLSDGRCLKMRHVSICYMLHIATSRKTLHVSLCDNPIMGHVPICDNPKTIHVPKRYTYRNESCIVSLHVAERYTVACFVSQSATQTPHRQRFEPPSVQVRTKTAWFELKPREKFPFRPCPQCIQCILSTQSPNPLRKPERYQLVRNQ